MSRCIYWRLHGAAAQAQTAQVDRAIEFPPEYLQAGLGILNYFSKVLYQRYPNIPVTVRIEQAGSWVRMIIETSEGDRDIVERTLEEYGLVVAGKMVPEAFLPNDLDVLALQTKLEMTEMELRMTYRHLQLAERYNAQQDRRITKLEDALLDLQQRLGDALQGEQHLARYLARSNTQKTQDIIALFQPLLAQVAAQQDQAVQQALRDLQIVLMRGVKEEDADTVTTALETVKQHDTTLYEDTIEAVYTVLGGVGGNVLTTILQNLGVIPM